MASWSDVRTQIPLIVTSLSTYCAYSNRLAEKNLIYPVLLLVVLGALPLSKGGDATFLTTKLVCYILAEDHLLIPCQWIDVSYVAESISVGLDAILTAAMVYLLLHEGRSSFER